jgi:hypothetical protein
MNYIYYYEKRGGSKMTAKGKGAANMPYEAMYKALLHGHGKQMALCKKALGEANELYGVILAAEREAGSEYSPEREGINKLMVSLGDVLSCMEDTDKAVDAAAIQ